MQVLTRLRRCSIVLVLALALGDSSQGETIEWNASAGGDFNLSANWTPNTVPSAADLAKFSIAMAGNVTLSAGAMPGSIAFDGSSTSFTLGTLAGNSLTLANAGSISILSTLATSGQTFQIHAPIILTPDSSITAGTFTLQNDSSDTTNTLVIAGGITAAATTSTETLTLEGSNTGANQITGIIGNGSAASLSLVKTGPGTWTLTGANTYTGSTTISGGKLALSGGNNRLATTSALAFTGSASSSLDLGSTSQSLAGLTVTTTGTTAVNTITGSGSLTITGGNILISGGDSSNVSNTRTLDMSGLSTFIYNRATGSITVGGSADFGATSVQGRGVLTLAQVNTLTAASFNVGGAGTGLSSLNYGTVHLGQTNTINATTIVVGMNKTTAVLDFQNLSNPTLKIRGTNGSDTDRANITVGTNNSGVTPAVGTIDLVNGITGASTLDAKVGTLTVGQNLRNTSGSGQASTGTFLMGMGTLDATAIVIGQQGAVPDGFLFSGTATGTFSLYGGTVTAVTLTLADKLAPVAPETIASNFNLYSGTLNATTIQRGAFGTGAGANSATINFNWVDGTISNISGVNQTVDGKTAVNGLTGGLNIVLNNSGNASGTHTWNVSNALNQVAATSTVVSTVTLSGAGGLTKTGTGQLTFNGANIYSGITTVSNGTLLFGKRTSLYNGVTSNWTATNLVVNSSTVPSQSYNVFTPVIAAFGVGGADGFTASDLDYLKTLGTATGGFKSGSFFGIDTTNAGGTFSYTGSVTNTNSGQNSIGLAKLGTGTLELTAYQSYTGGTVIAGGTLALRAGDEQLFSTGSVYFTGSSGTLDIGSSTQTTGAMYFSPVGINSYALTGAGGALNIYRGDFHVNGGITAAAGSNYVTLDMSGLSNFNYRNTAGLFTVGGRADVGPAVSGGGTLNMATTNVITASSFIVSPVSSGNTSPNIGIVHLGQTNTINATTFTVGVGKSISTLDFQSGLTNPTLKIRGTGGTDNDRANIIVGTNDSGAAANTATFDLVAGATGGTLDAMVGTLLIGQNTRNNAGLGRESFGTFTMGLGNLNATTIIIGQQAAVTAGNLSGAATGTLNLYGGTITATTLTLGNKLSGTAAQTITSNFNLYSGTLNATTIQRGTEGTGGGAGVTTINFNWVDGTIGNVAGSNQTVNGNTAVSGLTGGLNIVLNNTGNVSGTHTWSVSGSQTSTIQSTAILSGPGSLTKVGTGTLIFSTANTYTGLTTVSEGELQLNATGGQSLAGDLKVDGGVAKLLQASQINVAKSIFVNSGTFNLQTFNQTVANVQITGGTITGSTGVLTSTNAFDLRNGTVTAILGGTAGAVKSTAGTVTLSANNAFSGGVSVNGGTLVATMSASLGTNNGLSIANGATFAYRPATAGSLNLGTGAITLVNGSTIGAALGGTASQSVIQSSVAANATGAVTVLLYNIPGATVTTGVNNLITAASGLTSGGATYSLRLYNPTNYTVSGFTATDSAIRVSVASAPALTAAYWKGGLSAGNNVWALSDGSASNWTTNSAGTTPTAQVPGSGTTVTFSATGATNQGAMTLGANMSIASFTVSDTNAVTLNADGNSLTITTNGTGINVTSGAGAVTLNAPIILGATQSWNNSSSNPLTVAGAISGAFGIAKNGSGTLNLSGANTNTGSLTVNAGLVNISGSYVRGVTASGTASGQARISIQPGASLSGTGVSMVAGNGSNAVGAIYQSGGSVVLDGNLNLGLSGALGATSYGFFSMSGGSMTDTGGSGVRFRVGGGASYSTGVFYQTGGSITITFANGLEIAGNASTNIVSGMGVGYITGGSFTAVSNRIGYNSSVQALGLRGEQTVAGVASVTINGTTTLAQQAGDTGILNLNGGVYATRQINTGNSSGTSIINFNGGTLKAASSATSGSSFFTGLTKANLYAGGLTFDPNSQSMTIGQGFLAPAGDGVTTIAVTDGGTGYIGAPVVSITGGGGVGATAVANMVDDGTGNGTFKIGSITITSAGTGYTSAPTVTLSGGGGTTLATVGTATTAANVSGGITVLAGGSLTLSGASTYTGDTVVNVGATLIAANDSAFGVNSAATVNGLLRIAGKNLALGSLTGIGTVENNSATAGTLTLGGKNTNATYRGVIQNGTGAGTLSVVKTGTGTQVLTGNNTYTGTTTVSNGTLQVGLNGNGSLASTSGVTVNGTIATLAGTGSVNGTVSVLMGLIKPGDNSGEAIGTLNVGSLNLTSGGTGIFQIGGASSYDRINVINSGGLTLDGKLEVTTSLTGNDFDAAFQIGNIFDLLDWIGAMNGTFNVGSNLREGNLDTGLQFDLPDLSSIGRAWDVSQFTTNGTIIVVTPEPGRAMLLLLGMGAMVLRRRRRSGH